MPAWRSCTSCCVFRCRPGAASSKGGCSMAAVEQPAASGEAASAVVRIEGLRKRFGDNEVLKGIDLAVQPGEVVAIIGKSGSGKSTLLRCINGLETFQEGTLTVDGQPLAHGDRHA